MSTTFTANAKLQKPALGDTGWSTPLNANADTLDGLAPVGGLCVTLTEVPSASLNVKVAAGKFVAQDGTVTSYAGTSSQAITLSSTKVVYLDGTTGPWTLTVGTSYPATAHVRLATVVAGSSTITSVTDDRQCFPVAGSVLDGVNLTFGTSTGTKIGTAVSQKLGFWNATPIVQPSGAAQGAITDSTGSSATTTLVTVRNDTTAHAASDAQDNDHILYTLVNAMRTALVNAGIMKGSA
jgi:hypothetical protein